MMAPPPAPVASQAAASADPQPKKEAKDYGEPIKFRVPAEFGQQFRMVAFRKWPRKSLVAVAANHGMIASFSRALIEGLQHSMSDTDFDFALALPGFYRESVTEVRQIGHDRLHIAPRLSL
ncbi:MAG: hypothetical protein QOG25_1129 [Acetobacteraceae bacterium]|jgi:hypothetical protein|nr:hypothetical protein [Acetobacteraceae bacterium]